MVRDLVCDMEVAIESDTPRIEHAGVTYYFCSEHCQKAFQRDPDRYLDTGRAHE